MHFKDKWLRNVWALRKHNTALYLPYGKTNHNKRPASHAMEM
jgi:hypothetical protein